MEMEPDSLSSIGYLTNLAARLLVRSLERRMPDGATGPMPVFLALVDGGALPQAALARLAAVEQPTMANTLARMERDGLITRTPNPADRRSSLIALTPLGEERARIGMAAAGEVNALALSALAEDERTAHIARLRAIVAVLEADNAA